MVIYRSKMVVFHGYIQYPDVFFKDVGMFPASFNGPRLLVERLSLRDSEPGELRLTPDLAEPRFMKILVLPPKQK